MPIVDTLHKGAFIHRLKTDWYARFGHYSYTALETFYEYLEQLSDDLGEPVEFDPVAFDCEFDICDGEDEVRQYLEGRGLNLEEDDEYAIEELCAEQFQEYICCVFDGGVIFRND